MGVIIGLFATTLVGSIFSARGVFASREWLEYYSTAIGVKNPTAARVVCIIGVIVLAPVCLVCLLLLWNSLHSGG